MQTIEQLATLAEQALEERDYQKAQEFAWQQLDMDKLRETAVRQFMTALVTQEFSSQRTPAIRRRRRWASTSVVTNWGT